MSKFYSAKNHFHTLPRKTLDFLVCTHLPYVAYMTSIQITSSFPITFLERELIVEPYLETISKTKKNIIDSYILGQITYFEYTQYMKFVNISEIQVESSLLNSKIKELGLNIDLEEAHHLLEEIKGVLSNISISLYRSIIGGMKVSDLYHSAVMAIQYITYIEIAIAQLQESEITSCIIKKEELFISSFQNLTKAYHFFKTNSFIGAKKLEEYVAKLIHASVVDYDMEALEFNFADSDVLDVFKIFAEGLVKNNSIKILDFNFDAEEVCFNSNGEAISGIGADGAVFLAEVLKYNKSIEEVYLQCNSLGDEGAKAFAEMLKENDTLKVLDLCLYNNITSIGLIAIAKALMQNKGLIEFNVGDYVNEYDIGDISVAKAFSEMLIVNNTLTSLHIYSNELDDNWIKCFSNGLMGNIALEELTVMGRLTSSGIADLAKALTDHPEFTTLDLGVTPVKEDGALEILLLLQFNHNVRTVYFDSSNISRDMLSEINTVLDRNNKEYEEDIDLQGDVHLDAFHV